MYGLGNFKHAECNLKLKSHNQPPLVNTQNCSIWEVVGSSFVPLNTLTLIYNLIKNQQLHKFLNLKFLLYSISK